MSNSDRSSTAETTPISTPRGFGTGTGLPRKAEKEKENLFSWSHRHLGFSGGNSSYVDSALLESDLEDSTFPLFNEPTGPIGMGSRTTPIDIAAPSQYGSNRQSAMSAALQNTSGNEARPSTGMSIGSGYRFGHRDSVSAAQPISMQSASNQNKPRRESLAGSMVTGMSWGGASVGSWIRDEYASLFMSLILVADNTIVLSCKGLPHSLINRHHSTLHRINLSWKLIL